MSSEENRVSRFLSAFNVIEQELRSRLGLEMNVGFREASRQFSRTVGWWRSHEPIMETAAQIRNFLVHTRGGQEFVAAVPHEDTVLRVESIASMLIKPKLVIPAFQKQVISFGPDQSLVELLRAVQLDDFTFFPVIGQKGFRGLVTGTGLMRWLAGLTAVDPLTDLSEIPIVQVLEQEESRANYEFVSRTTPVHEALELFRQRVGLEAVLITESGRTNEKLLGIVTVWDVTG